MRHRTHTCSGTKPPSTTARSARYSRRSPRARTVACSRANPLCCARYAERAAQPRVQRDARRQGRPRETTRAGLRAPSGLVLHPAVLEHCRLGLGWIGTYAYPAPYLEGTRSTRIR